MEPYEKAAFVQNSNENLHENEESQKKVSCIFKVNDDIRQDRLALQVIRVFQEIFKEKGLDLYVYPYLTISNRTGEVFYTHLGNRKKTLVV